MEAEPGPARAVLRREAGLEDPRPVLGRDPDALVRDPHLDAPARALEHADEDPRRAVVHALHRLEQQGWITSEWGASENNRRARYYSLTRTGRKQLEREEANWQRLSAAVQLVLQHS